MKPRLTVILLFACLWSCCCVAGDYDTITASYGEPERIAGLGQQEDVNGWLPSMEGTNAFHVELSNTHMTMADAAGNLYFADKESHAILKMTPDGNIHTVVGTHAAGNGSDAEQPGTSVALSNPNGLYVLPEGTTYILDRDNDKIRRLDTNGTVRTVVTNTLPLLAGRGLWVSADESSIFYAAHTDLRKWTESEGVTTYASGFSSLGNIDVDPTDGNVVVTDRGAHRVYRVYPDGSLEVIAGDGTAQNHGSGGPSTNAGLDEVRGIAFLPHGGYFLATQGDGDIWYVDTDSIAHEFIQGSGSSTPLPYDGICEPRGISIAPWGDLIITENDYAVVRIVRRTIALSEAGSLPGLGFSLAWHSMPSADYSVQFSDSLTPTNWQTRGQTSGSPAAIISTYTDTNALSVSQGFYRVRKQDTQISSKIGQTADFLTRFHDVSGTAEIQDARTIRVRSFNYDATGLLVYMVVSPNSSFSPYTAISGDLVRGEPYVNETLDFTIPPETSLADVNYISVWCVDVSVSFGDGQFR